MLDELAEITYFKKNTLKAWRVSVKSRSVFRTQESIFD